MQWYGRVGHPKVQNPNNRVQNVQRPSLVVGPSTGAPPTGKLGRRLKYIVNLLRFRGEEDRPVSPSFVTRAADLLDMCSADGDLAEFGELDGEVGGVDIAGPGHQPDVGPSKPARKTRAGKRKASSQA